MRHFYSVITWLQFHIWKNAFSSYLYPQNMFLCICQTPAPVASWTKDVNLKEVNYRKSRYTRRFEAKFINFSLASHTPVGRIVR